MTEKIKKLCGIPTYFSFPLFELDTRSFAWILMSLFASIWSWGMVFRLTESSSLFISSPGLIVEGVEQQLDVPLTPSIKSPFEIGMFSDLDFIFDALSSPFWKFTERSK